MTQKASGIYDSFNGKLVGTYRMKRMVCETISLMSQDVIDYVTRTCWFMSSMEDAWAYTFTGNELKHQHLIFLSDELMAQDERQISFSIAHEIGHVILKHRNSVLVKQSKHEINLQERQADEFANKFQP